jgi:aminopeptidase N
MRYLRNLCLYVLFLIPVIPATPLYAQSYIHHEMEILLQPEQHSLFIRDIITLPESFLPENGGSIYFSLHSGMQPVSTTPGVSIIREEGKPDSAHSNSYTDTPTQEECVFQEDFRVTLPAGVHRFEVNYKGEIHHPLQEGEVYARSFSETPGIISPQGIYLNGSTYWYPVFNDDLVTFTMDVRLPRSWDIITQGERIEHREEDTGIHIRWKSEEPQDEIYLIGGEFTEYIRDAKGIQVMIFLRTPDEDLSNKYLDVGVQYLEMYHDLIGPYPYKKFAVVENFWETGYGMPSFTLLGPKVIRFPFILHSSYPHEILHNWWGNGVFVDYQTGNWCEGLTAYLADHLIQEQKGAGAEYRRTALQKYIDYVTKGKDISLTKFHTRHNPVTEAVGYGKALMFFHMLRQQVGDDVFVQALQKFYRENIYHRASFDDIHRTFTDIINEDLQREFQQWIARSGAPVLRIRYVSVQSGKEGYTLTAVIEQVQPEPAYKLYVPVAITLEGQEYAYQTTLVMDKREIELSFSLPARPVKLDVDPEFDLFRKLDPYETPSSLSKAFGAGKTLVVISSAAPEELLQGYRELGEFWQKSQSGEVSIKLDNEIDWVPSDCAIWLLGWENQFLPQFTSSLINYDVTITGQDIHLDGKVIGRNNHSMVITTRHPENPNLALTLVATDSASTLQKLKQNLPYYSKYSYLCFEGDELNSIIKGNWPVLHSPLSIPLSISPSNEHLIKKKVQGKLKPRRPLTYPPPVFSEERILQDVRFLASEQLQGRGFGTFGLDTAADYIASQFSEAGLQPPGNDDNGFFQTWEDFGGEQERQVIMKNVIGIIPGSKPEWTGQSVVVGAHYDHLGLGWPDIHKGDKGKIHYGADDNASGVAVLLELARLLGKNWKPERTVVFITFTGEEAGLKGSKYYVTNEKRFPVSKAIGMVNIDTVGRLGDKKLMVFGTGSAREWSYIFMGASSVTGVPVELIAHDFGGSDQKNFLHAGVPAVQFFSGLHTDYHRPTDTVDKIDPAGMVKTAKVLKEVIEYLAHRPDPLTSTKQKLIDHEDKNTETASAARKVSLGTMPNFSYTGSGLCIKNVIPGSSAEKAGLQAGDVIIQINDNQIIDLHSFSEQLKKLQPGEKISITFMRAGKQFTTEAAVEER